VAQVDAHIVGQAVGATENQAVQAGHLKSIGSHARRCTEACKRQPHAEHRTPPQLAADRDVATIVMVFLPLIFGLRRTLFYRRVVFFGGSLLIVGVALVWLVERVFDLTLISA